MFNIYSLGNKEKGNRRTILGTDSSRCACVQRSVSKFCLFPTSLKHTNNPIKVGCCYLVYLYRFLFQLKMHFKIPVRNRGKLYTHIHIHNKGLCVCACVRSHFLFSVFEVSKCSAVSRYYTYNQGEKKQLTQSVIEQDVPKGS